MNCEYKISYFPNRLETPTVLWVNVGEQYNGTVLTNLTLDTVYTVFVQSYNSEKATLTFPTPTCMEIKNNFTLCRKYTSIIYLYLI